MVCKEEVLLWFKDLDSYKRIDVLYELLNMCLPFELRFIGSCIEELGKHTYQELRGPSITANDLEKLSKDVSFNQGISDEGVRHRLLIYLSVLSSRNFSVASWMYRKLLRTDAIEEYVVKEKGKDDVLHSEFLLLFTMALHHPAFTFEHKQFFSRILSGLIDIRENRISSKHSALGYPPGFGYPTTKSQEQPTVPVKTAQTPCGDSSSIVFQQHSGVMHLPPHPQVDFVPSMWTRPGYPYGAPEIPPFPPSTMSPLVSQAASPSQSRSTSPLRVPMVRPVPPPPVPVVIQPSNVPQPAVPALGVQPAMAAPPPPINGPLPPPVEAIVTLSTAQLTAAQLTPATPLEQLSQSSLPYVNPILQPPEMKLIDDETSKMPLEEKHICEILWPPINTEVKPNGIRFSSFGNKRPYLLDQMQALSIDGENALYQSNSSGNSTPNETPPGTPSITPSTTPHGPGRGDMKSRSNGMPFIGNPPPPIPDTTSPPTFSNSSVPYSYSQPFALPPNRSMFPYNQTYRPSFTTHYPTFPENSFTYTFPYYYYSSPVTMTRTPPGCYNCGAPNHVGSECTGQNIEDITQKKAYQLEYTSPLPDSEK